MKKHFSSNIINPTKSNAQSVRRKSSLKYTNVCFVNRYTFVTGVIMGGNIKAMIDFSVKLQKRGNGALA